MSLNKIINMVQEKRIILGLTGGIASGKSTAGKYFQELGWVGFSTDQIVAELLTKDDKVVSEIKGRWGKAVTNSKGLNKKEIGRIIFRDADERKWLESILHPKVRLNWQREVKKSNSRRIFVEIPLLFENNLAKSFDLVVCVYASEITQMKRLLDRGLTKEESNARIYAQLPVKEKSRLADFVLLGDGSLPFLKRQIGFLHTNIV